MEDSLLNFKSPCPTAEDFLIGFVVIILLIENLYRKSNPCFLILFLQRGTCIASANTEGGKFQTKELKSGKNDEQIMKSYMAW